MEGKGRTDHLNLKKATSWELWPLTQGWSSPVVTHRKKAGRQRRAQEPLFYPSRLLLVPPTNGSLLEARG